MEENNYRIDVKTTDGKLHTFFSSGADELEAIDKVKKGLKEQGRDIFDIKVVGK